MSDKSNEAEDEHKLIKVRREKLDQLREKGLNPFGGRFDTTHQPGELKQKFEEGLEVTIAGRMTAKRGFGKSSFFELSDLDGKIQCFIGKNEVEAEYFETFKLMDRGDWMGVEGENVFSLKKGSQR